MKHLRNVMALVACCTTLAIIVGSPAVAGGSSDTSGEDFHCYLFFELPDGSFAQAMVNDSDRAEVIAKAEEYIEKYTVDEGGDLALAVGNITKSVCEPQVCLTCTEDCDLERDQCIDGCGGNAKCVDVCKSLYDRCIGECREGTCERRKDCPPDTTCCPDGTCAARGQKCKKAIPLLKKQDVLVPAAP